MWEEEKAVGMQDSLVNALKSLEIIIAPVWGHLSLINQYS